MFRITSKSAPLWFGLVALAGCPGDDVPADTEGTSTGETTTTTAPDPTTTISVDSSSGGEESTGPVCEPACAFGECCVAGACFDAGPPTCAGGCSDDEVCTCPQGVDPCNCDGVCEAVACGIDGNYDPCFDTQCPNGYICLVDNVMNPSVSWCAFEGCGDECDCPTPPDGFDPQCSDLTGSGTNHCSISSSGGCPDGMVSFGTFCVWPADNGGEPLYGDCINDGLQCNIADGLTCISDMESTFGWCSIVDCANAMDCEPAPATGDAPPACAPILNMGMTNACILDCSMGQTCPDGMSCFMDAFCTWTQQIDGYANCGLPEVDCPMGETCIDDMPMGMTDPMWSVCSQGGCMDASDCTFTPPATGNAPVACVDPTGMGGPATCVLDCSMGEMCPDGMSCINDTFCAWPQGPMLFADNFESGDLSAGWTVNDVDMQMPAMQVNFVTDAWVVSNMVDPDMNNAAVSTSWYMPAGMADDWLITPQLMIGPNARVYWQARTVDPAFPDGYEVRISTATNDPMDFLANAELVTVNPEDPDYSLRYVDLAAAGYMDQMVYLAWRNIANDGTLLLVDDVAIQDLP